VINGRGIGHGYERVLSPSLSPKISNH
jgi:hypothetical protein